VLLLASCYVEVEVDPSNADNGGCWWVPPDPVVGEYYVTVIPPVIEPIYSCDGFWQCNDGSQVYRGRVYPHPESAWCDRCYWASGEPTPVFGWNDHEQCEWGT